MDACDEDAGAYLELVSLGVGCGGGGRGKERYDEIRLLASIDETLSGFCTFVPF